MDHHVVQAAPEGTLCAEVEDQLVLHLWTHSLHTRGILLSLLQDAHWREDIPG